MLEPWSIPGRANAIHEPSRCPGFPLLSHELSRTRKHLGAPEPPPVRLLRNRSSQRSSLAVLSQDCDARLESSIDRGYGSRLPTRAIWRSLLRPHYAGSGVASCPKPWVNAHHAVLGDEAKYVPGDVGVKGPYIPWPATLSTRLLISLRATLPATTRKLHTHTFCNGSRVATGESCRGPTIIPNRQAWQTILPDVDLHQLHRFSAAAGTLACHFD